MEEEMTADELKAFLEANKDEIQSAVKEKLIAGLLENHRWEISAEITKTVEAFVAAEIVPEVKKYLRDQKGALVEGAIAGAAEIGNALSKALAEHAMKRLTGDVWQARQVFKALFD